MAGHDDIRLCFRLRPVPVGSGHGSPSGTATAPPEPHVHGLTAEFFPPTDGPDGAVSITADETRTPADASVKAHSYGMDHGTGAAVPYRRD